MLPKYTTEYEAQFMRRPERDHYSGNDPVAGEEFLAEIPERGYRIKAIRHDGLEWSKADFDKLIKTAAGRQAAKSICTSLGIATEEEHYRFGFTR